MEGELREDGSCEGSRIVVISDEALENDKRRGGTLDYESLEIGVYGVIRTRGYPSDPITKERTVQEAADDLRKYLTEKGYTGWEISEVFE